MKKETLAASSIDSLTTKISKYIDHIVQPYIKGLRLYVKDSVDFILEINNLEKIPKNSILATMDDYALYTNIQNNEDIKAVETTFK